MNRNIKALKLSGLILVALAATDGRAAYIVDTGPGLNVDQGVGIDENQWVASAFTVTGDVLLNSVEGWIGGGGSGTMSITIYDSAGEIPGSQIYTNEFSLFDTTPGVNSWHGATGLDWALNAGTYWASFEVRPGQTFSGVIPWDGNLASGCGSCVANPMQDNAVYSSGYPASGGWHENDSLNFGLRIDADVSPVPIPVAGWLFGSGLLGLIGFSKKRKAVIADT
jgi:hypothetical protein